MFEELAKAGQISDEERDIMIQQQAKLLLMEQELAGGGASSGVGSAATAAAGEAATAAAGEAAAPFAPAVPVAVDCEGGGIRTPHRGEAGADDRPPESPSV